MAHLYSDGNTEHKYEEVWSNMQQIIVVTNLTARSKGLYYIYYGINCLNSVIKWNYQVTGVFLCRPSVTDREQVKRCNKTKVFFLDKSVFQFQKFGSYSKNNW